MPVSDFECQIARGQIGRYLGGSVLSPEAMRGLEEHIAECPGCKALVAERRAALKGMIEGETPTHAVVSMPVKAESAAVDANPLVAALRARGEAKPEAPQTKSQPKAVKSEAGPRYASAKGAPKYAKTENAKPLVGKPLALAGLLAVVLIGMSYLSKAVGGQGALGGKASSTFAVDALPSPTPTAAQPTVSQPKADTTPETKSPSDPGKNVAPTVASSSVEPHPAASTTPGQDLPGSDEAQAKAPKKIQTEKASAVAKAPVVQTDPKAPAAVKIATKAQAPTLKASSVKIATPKPTVTAKPVKRVVRKAVRRKAVLRKRIVTHRPKHVKPHGAVRVYGPDGRPL